MPARPLAGPSAPGRALGALIACPLAGVMFSVPARYEPPLGRASPERALRVESSAAAPGTKVPLAGTNRGLPAAAGSLDGAPGGACRLGPVSGRQPAPVPGPCRGAGRGYDGLIAARWMAGGGERAGYRWLSRPRRPGRG